MRGVLTRLMPGVKCTTVESGAATPGWVETSVTVKLSVVSCSVPTWSAR